YIGKAALRAVEVNLSRIADHDRADYSHILRHGRRCPFRRTGHIPTRRTTRHTTTLDRNGVVVYTSNLTTHFVSGRSDNDPLSLNCAILVRTPHDLNCHADLDVGQSTFALSRQDIYGGLREQVGDDGIAL